MTFRLPGGLGQVPKGPLAQSAVIYLIYDMTIIVNIELQLFFFLRLTLWVGYRHGTLNISIKVQHLTFFSKSVGDLKI
jgi:hypothetical protein